MIRCCPKFFNSLQSNCGGTVCLSRVYVASSTIDFNQRRHASGENQPPRRFKKLFYTSVGLTLVGVGGVVVYAKSDPKFRKVLDSYVPGSDKFIRIIYQEEGSFNVDIPEQLSSIQDKLLSIPSDIYKQISGTTSEKPASVLPKVKELTSEEITKPKPKHAVDTSRKAITVVEVSGTDLKSIVEEAISIYHELINTITGKSDELLELIDKVDDAEDPKKTWKEIRAKMDEFAKFGEEVNNKMIDAGDKVKKFQTLMKKGGTPDNEIKELESKLISAKEQAEQLKNNKLDGATKYVSKVEEALKRTNDELMTLFPNYHPGSKNLRLTQDELDLFMYYSLHKILYYQKEISKMDAVIKQKLEQVMKKKENGLQLAEMVKIKVDEAKRKMKEDFDKKMLEMKKGCDDEVHNALKRQEQVHMDLLNDQLALKEKEVERKLSRLMETKLVEEEAKLQAELAEMTGRMQGLNEAIAKRALQDHKAQTSQALWSAAQALFDSLKHGDGDRIKPLKDLVVAIKNSSAKGDDLVETVLATIPKVAVERGVYPEDALKERFIKVEESAWRVAGVPEGGASLPKLLMAWLQSHLVIRASEPIPSAELNNEPFDPKELNNYDILQRARYYVDRGDMEQALKYMNLLKGGARAVSSDWIKEAIVLLETEQAAHLLLAHASASGMIYS